MSASTPRPSRASRRRTTTAGDPGSLWLRLLALSSAAATAGLLVTAVIAVVMNGGLGALSVLCGGALVIVFFAISLLAGHFVGRNNPSGAIGLMVALYFVKVVVFGVVFLVLGAPGWLHGRWFVTAAVVTVVLWQIAELYGFSKARLLIFNEPTQAAEQAQDSSGTTEGGR
ncbi:ATP synthase protein I [Arthrobacter woluwensis]|uniref:hypothetical protein n=1 Tax=Arthrobacter woluwensis TaxID=156980 RepID=UPI00277F46C1|nr:hypothetical protein [Arthrobacter woluwensis]MDQ0709294.1 ATP synthase protein I [Arthrobacter woluwensis]